MSTAFVFPGQGSQYVGMGAAWYRASNEARMFCEQADAQLGYALSKLCFEGPSDDLNRTEYTQPAVFVISLLIWQAIKRDLPAPHFVAGHSLGEFSALVASGAVSFTDALALVAARGRLMATAGEHAPGGMAVLLGATVDAAQLLCAKASETAGLPLVVANDNCPGQVVVSGAGPALDVAATLARDHGIRRFRRLAISVAPHSPLMAASQAGFAELLKALNLRTPAIPVVMNATATPLSDPEQIREALLRQLTSPVRWRESLLWLWAQGVTEFVEMGPKNVLTGLVRRTLKDAQAVAMEERAPAEQL